MLSLAFICALDLEVPHSLQQCYIRYSLTKQSQISARFAHVIMQLKQPLSPGLKNALSGIQLSEVYV